MIIVCVLFHDNQLVSTSYLSSLGACQQERRLPVRCDIVDGGKGWRACQEVTWTAWRRREETSHWRGILFKIDIATSAVESARLFSVYASRYTIYCCGVLSAAASLSMCRDDGYVRVTTLKVKHWDRSVDWRT